MASSSVSDAAAAPRRNPRRAREVVPPKPGFDSSRDFEPNRRKPEEMQFMDSSSETELIRGLMGVVGVRDRKVAIVPGRVIDELKQEERWVPMREIMQRPGVTMAVEGPWLDDWSAVPPEVAAQYNTSPHYSGPHPPLEPEPPTSIREGSSGEMNA